MSPAAPPRLFAVLGHPIAHSLSPRLQQGALDALGVSAVFLAIDVPPERFESSLRDLQAQGAAGLSITAPLKELAFRASAATTAEARASGVANCLRAGAGGFEATNTDGMGFVSFARDVGLVLDGRRVVLLGGGGAAAGLAPALTGAGATCVVLARDENKARRLAGLSKLEIAAWNAGDALAGADLVIQTTPLGARPDDPLPCDPARLAPGAVCVDLRYAPRRTPWLAAARALGHVAYDGLGLLVHQGAHALRYWLGVEPPLDRLRELVGWKPAPLGEDD
jgi:shikimate dehydrogenase